METDEVIIPEQRRPRQSFSRNALRLIRRYGFWITILLLMIFSAGSFELGRYSVYQAHPELAGQEEAASILNKVGQLIQLPQGETPTMATITNASLVKTTQPFLANAENGDVIIVYANAKTALLYRPSTNKLIAVGPVTNGTSDAASEPAEQETPIKVTPSKSSTSSSTNDSSSTESSK